VVFVVLLIKMLLPSFKSTGVEHVIILWQACNLLVPQNDLRKDIASKLKVVFRTPRFSRS